MKTNRHIVLLLLLMASLLSVAQNRVGMLKAPSAPTPIEYKERTIQDLLYYPFSCIEVNMTTQELARQTVENTFGTCETINGFPGLHASGSCGYGVLRQPRRAGMGDYSPLLMRRHSRGVKSLVSAFHEGSGMYHQNCLK